MAYNKEYYEANKDRFKASRDKYRHNPKNRDKINTQQREKYRNMSEEKKEALLQKNKEYRAENIIKSRIQYKINQKKRQLKNYYECYEILTERSIIASRLKNIEQVQETLKEMQVLQAKIDQKNAEITNLEKEKELL